MRVLLSIMKKLLFALFALASVVLFASDSRSEIAKKLYGRIRVVSSIGEEDYRVRIVNGIGEEDLRVRITSYASAPGMWEFVNGIGEENYRVRIVNGIGEEDLTIRFVTGHGEEGPTR